MDLPPSTSSAPKLRLMCSYGGRIVPRPKTKSFYYFGGENRLITIPTTDNSTTTLTLASLSTLLSNSLRLNIPFTLKYQLPNHDLDSLISITADDDLQIMLEEHKRLSSSSTLAPSRIRLFLFPVGNGDKAELTHPKRDSWLVDALRSTRAGYGGESGEQAESIPLETSSSFGSTSSSISLSSLPPIKVSPDSGQSSDECVGSTVSNVQTGTFQDQVGHFASMENRLCSNPFESDKKFADPPSGVEMHKPIHASGFPINLMHLPQQQTQVIHEDTHYVPPNMPGMQPVTSYYPVYYPVPQQQQQLLHYQSNQPYPMYYVPVAPTHPYNIHVQHGMVQAMSISDGQSQALPNTQLIPTQVVVKEIASVPKPVADLTAQQYQKIPEGNQQIHVPHTETETRFAGAQIQHQPQSFGVVAGETANQTNKLDDDPARVQIYKSQPPPPMLPPQCKTMTNAPTLLLSEALAKLHTDNTEQQITASEQ